MTEQYPNKPGAVDKYTNRQEFEPVQLEKFICIDVDRCVLKTTTFFEKNIIKTLRALANEQCGSDKVAFQRRSKVLETLQKDQAENVGMAFDFMAVYNERIDEVHRVTAETMAERIVASMSKDGKIMQDHIDAILADGALELIEAVHEMPDTQWAFLTSGGETTQWVKLNVLSYIIQQELGIVPRAQIITTEHKARDIDTLWRGDNNEGFCIPGTIAGVDSKVAQTIIILDDKGKNLIASNMQGITPLLIQNPERDDKVSGAINLHEALERIKNIDKQ